MQRREREDLVGESGANVFKQQPQQYRDTTVQNGLTGCFDIHLISSLEDLHPQKRNCLSATNGAAIRAHLRGSHIHPICILGIYTQLYTSFQGIADHLAAHSRTQVGARRPICILFLSIRGKDGPSQERIPGVVPSCPNRLSYALNRFGFILDSDLIHRHDFAVCVA